MYRALALFMANVACIWQRKHWCSLLKLTCRCHQQAGSPVRSLGMGSEASQQTAATLAVAAPPPLNVATLAPAAGSLSGTPQSAERRLSLPWQAAPKEMTAEGAAGLSGGPGSRLTPVPQGSMPPDTLQALLEEMEGLPPLEGALAGPACLDW